MSPIIREVTIGPCRLIQGDCMEVLPLIGKVDAVVTDPPYGLGEKWSGGGGSKRSSWRFDPSEAKEWDSAVVADLLPIVAAGRKAIIWGGHLYPLPPSRGWLLWDKKQSGDWTTGHAELAWTNLDQPVRAFRMSQVEAHTNMHKEHPTQKPTPLIKWCLSFIQDAKTILDPFMGSGTTGVACIQTGRRFIGIEKEPKYFDIAVKRIQRAWDLKCSELPFEQVEPQKQTELFEEEVK